MAVEIAILHYSSYPVVGGVEITMYHHARLLAGDGYRVEILAGAGSKFDERIPFVHIPEIGSRHPQVLEVGAELAAGEVSGAFHQLRQRIYDRLQVSLARARVLIVHNAVSLHKNLPLTAALADLVESQGLPLIAWCHDFAWQDELYTADLHPGYPWDLLRTPWAGVRYVAVSEHRREMLADLFRIAPGQVRVIPPGVAVDELFRLDPAAKRLVDCLDLFQVDPLMLLPARITRRKNIQFAIRVTGALRREMPHAGLLVTGPPGPHNPANLAYLQQLQELRKSLGLETGVHFLYEYGEGGEPLHVTNEMMAGLYQISDLLLFPSLREGFGIPALEAGLFRMPVFAADIPPVRESTAGLAHYFDPQGEPQEVARQIHAWLQADQGYSLRHRVLTGYTWEAVVEQRLIPLLESVRAAGRS